MQKQAIKSYAQIGPVARQLCILFDGVVVGSAASRLYKSEGLPEGSDIDLVVPLDQWTKACKLIPPRSRSNAYGGFKFLDGGLMLDVWADDAARVLFMSPFKEKTSYLWSPKYGGAIQWVQ